MSKALLFSAAVSVGAMVFPIHKELEGEVIENCSWRFIISDPTDIEGLCQKANDVFISDENGNYHRLYKTGGSDEWDQKGISQAEIGDRVRVEFTTTAIHHILDVISNNQANDVPNYEDFVSAPRIYLAEDDEPGAYIFGNHLDTFEILPE